MTRAKPRGSHGDALWQWTAAGDVQAGQVTTNPLTVVCPTCRARIREQCTRPGRRGRKTRHTPHPSRIDLSTGVSR